MINSQNDEFESIWNTILYHYRSWENLFYMLKKQT